jgi:hypothetical protein
MLIIDPVHKIGIHFATGAFHTSQLKESGEPPLFLCRNLMSPYTAKLAAQLSHPSCGVVFHPTYHNRNKLHGSSLACGCALRKPPSHMIATYFSHQTLSHSTHMSYAQPATFDSSDTSEVKHLPMCVTLFLPSSYPPINYMAVYADGSFVHGLTGFSSVFEAKLYGICFALLYVISTSSTTFSTQTS